MHLTIGDKIAATLAAAYFAYRVFTAWRDGIYYGDGDLDVESHNNPFAFSLAVLSAIVLVVLCTFLVVA